ncbi:MAG: PRC-barrel domain-containing protein [Gemmatimonadaceae bacterium]
MLTSLKVLENYAVSAVDGEIGRVVDVLVDDQLWAVRYLVVSTGEWLNTRRVLIATNSFRDIDSASRRFSVALTADQVRQCPLIDTDAPVSRYHERLQAQHYGFPFYWNSAGLIGLGLYPGMATPAGIVLPLDELESDDHDVHLRSAKEVRGYHVVGVGDNVGHIEDFVADDTSWAVKYLVVDTSNWWLGQQVLVAPRCATGVNWDERTVKVTMDRQAIQGSPIWNSAVGIDSEYAATLENYYSSSAPR